jgi:tetratricopeptide (TPR) repeat protein
MSALLAAGNWASHEATLCLVFFLALGAIAAYAIAARAETRSASHPLMILALVPVAAALVATSVRPARADLLAGAAERLGLDDRWIDAATIEEQRVRLTPESDLAWSALGSARLEAAKHADGAAQRVGFERASAALEEARRRNPLDWFHVRNLASLQRVWAAADRPGRAAHLEAADRHFQKASEFAPAFARLWAEWGNVDAERGRLADAFMKLDRSAALGGGEDAGVVADAILLATGLNIRSREGRRRAAEDFERRGLHALASQYTDDPPPRR